MALQKTAPSPTLHHPLQPETATTPPCLNVPGSLQGLRKDPRLPQPKQGQGALLWGACVGGQEKQ
jgi:hypothetical protein